jgi:lipoprotein-releasing system ATP-binding protein
MSNVQHPTSESETSEAVESLETYKAGSQAEKADEIAEGRKSVGGNAQAGAADVGHRTLDFGLHVTDLRKSFSSGEERIEVLRGVSFSASAGETVAIMGPSGAGKSTLLHLLGGLEAADHGTIVAGEVAIDTASRSALARFRNSRVGFVFQFHHLLPDLTAAENVSLPLMIARTRRSEAMQRAVQALASVGLGDRESHFVGQLSGGEQQRVAVCRALITRPQLVLADEPTGNLDTAIGNEIASSLTRYARTNRAIVVIATHNRSLAEACDRILTLQDGRLSGV